VNWPPLIAKLESALSELRSKQLINDTLRRHYRLSDAALIAILSELDARLCRIEERGAR